MIGSPKLGRTIFLHQLLNSKLINPRLGLIKRAELRLLLFVLLGFGTEFSGFFGQSFFILRR
jgi:hypothetical protein